MPAPQEKERDYRARNVIAAVLNEAWAMEEGKLDQIRAFLEARSNGVQLTEAEIQEAINQSRPRAEIIVTLGLDREAQAGGEEDDRLVIDGVEVLQLFGTLGPRMNLMMRFSGGTSTQQFGAAFDRAMRDPSVKTVLIEVDSPGGVVTGTEELRRKIFEARGKKRIVAVARGMVASAAYYIASAADELIATPSTEVGSIGVYMVTREVTAAADKAGIKFFVFRAGTLKASGIEYEKLAPERAAALQARIDGPYQQFISAVAENRRVTPTTVAQSFGQGTVYLADEAQRRGMIDRVATLEDVFEVERAAAKKLLAAGSGLPTAADSADAGGTGARFSHDRKDSHMDPKIKAALYARGLIESLEASDDVCRAALAGHFGGSAKIPTDTQKVLDSLTGQTNIAATAEPLRKPDDDAKLQAAHQREVDEAKAAAAAEERKRVAEIHAKAEVLRGNGFQVSPELVQKAIDTGLDPNEAAGQWASQPTGERGVGRLEATESDVDKFHAAAVEALAARYFPTGTRAAERAERPQLSAAARELSGARLVEIARRDLLAANRRVGGTDENVAAQWLAMHGGLTVLPSAQEGAAQSAASFPSLLSSLVGKTLDQAIELSDTTYQAWTARMADLPDLKPQLIVAIGGLNRLDEIGDDEKAPQLKFTEETPGWIQIGRFANKVGLTPIMVANDDLDAFMLGVQQLGAAHDRTLNTLCLAILTGNVTLLDGYSLYDDTNHGNDIAAGSGGKPSYTEMADMRLKHRKQTGIGGIGYVATPPAIALVPSTLETDAEQTFLSAAAIAEQIMKATDATLNVFRGRMRFVVEPDLELSSSAIWYTFADPARRRTVVHAFQRGYGRGGKRTSWFDPDTETRYYRVEGRMAAAAAGYRGTVRNAGS